LRELKTSKGLSSISSDIAAENSSSKIELSAISYGLSPPENTAPTPANKKNKIIHDKKIPNTVANANLKNCFIKKDLVNKG